MLLCAHIYQFASLSVQDANIVDRKNQLKRVSNTSVRQGKGRGKKGVWFIVVSRDKRPGSGRKGDIINEIKPQNSIILPQEILFGPV